MEITNVQTDNVQDFLKSFMNDDQNSLQQQNENQQQPQGGDAVPGSDENKNLQNTNQVDPNKDKDKTQEFLDNLDKDGKGKKDEPVDFRTVAEKLIQDKVLFGFEGDAKVETTEDFVELLTGNIEFKAKETVEKAWSEKINSLPPDAKLLLSYVEQGVSDGRDFAKLLGQVAARNEIADLDPKKEADQEQIVLIQLRNTGLSEKDAREEIADLKTANKLADRASKFFPALKQAYDNQVKQTLLEKEQEAQEREQYIDNNSLNVKYFLEEDSTFLPFKITDVKHKSAIFELAAKPVALDADGEVVYAWQDYLQSLQRGTEAQYKKYMKVMAFLANPDEYDKNVIKKGADNEKKNIHKKLDIGQNRNNSLGSRETNDAAPVIPRSKSGPWGL